jgi:hypothetical protein
MVRIVQQYERGVLFRLGRVIGVRQPGLIFIAPVLTWPVAFWVCRWLRATQVHPATPTAGVRLRRTPNGGYETIWPDPGRSRTYVE